SAAAQRPPLARPSAAAQRPPLARPSAAAQRPPLARALTATQREDALAARLLELHPQVAEQQPEERDVDRQRHEDQRRSARAEREQAERDTAVDERGRDDRQQRGMRPVAGAVLPDRELERSEHDGAETGVEQTAVAVDYPDDRPDRPDEDQQLGEGPRVPRGLRPL